MRISPRHVNINGSVINANVHFQITLLLKNTRLKNIPTNVAFSLFTSDYKLNCYIVHYS